MKWLDLVKFLVPLVLPLVLKKNGAALTPYVMQGITDAEALAGAKGAAKLQHAVTVAMDGVHGANAALGKTLIDPDLSLTALEGATSTAVDIINLVHRAQASEP